MPVQFSIFLAEKIQWLGDEVAYCKYCVLFSKFRDRHINTLGILIEQPLTNWKRLLKSLQITFLVQNISMEALELASNYQSVMNNKTPSIRHQIDPFALQYIQQNRVILRSIIDTIILCGQQGIQFCMPMSYTVPSESRKSFKMPSNLISEGAIFKNFWGHAPRPPSGGILHMHLCLHYEFVFCN